MAAAGFILDWQSQGAFGGQLGRGEPLIYPKSVLPSMSCPRDCNTPGGCPSGGQLLAREDTWLSFLTMLGAWYVGPAASGWGVLEVGAA